MSHMPGLKSATSFSSSSSLARTPSGPMVAAGLIMNKRADVNESLYYICQRLIAKLEKVPGMKAYLNLAFSSAEECSEQQAMLLSQRPASSSSHHNSTSSLDSEISVRSKWDRTMLTFSAGMLPAQINYDPVTPVWRLFQQGVPLCLIFNSLKPEHSIPLVSSDDLKVCKMNVYRFLSCCKQYLDIRDEDLFPITSVFADDTNNLLKVIKVVNSVLDLDPRFTAPEIEETYKVTDARSKVVKELVESERKFVQDLETLLRYRDDVMKRELISSEDLGILFPNLPEIVDFQRRFLVGLECNASVPEKYQRIGSVFLHAGVQGFKIYDPWSLLQTQAIDVIAREAGNLKRSSSLIDASYELQSFLIKPVQRLCKYPLLLQQLLKLTDSSWPNYNELEASLESSKEVAHNVNEAQRKSENVQLVKDLQERVVDWRGHGLLNVGELLFSNTVVVKDLLSDGPSSEKEVHCYMFEKIIYFFKEMAPKNKILSARKKSSASLTSSSGSLNGSQSNLYLNGRVFISNINVITSNDAGSFGGPGRYLTIRWKGTKERGGCVIKFRSEEQLVRWEAALKRLTKDQELDMPKVRNRDNSGSSEGEYLPKFPPVVDSPMGSARSSASSIQDSFKMPHVRQKSEVSLLSYGAPGPYSDEKKNRSVSSPATLVGSLAHHVASVELREQVNIKLTYKNENVHLSVQPHVVFADLLTTFLNKLRLTIGDDLKADDTLKLKYRDEDDDLIQFRSDDDWTVARDMLNQIADEESRILNIVVTV
ncbi:unnamed protein product [Kuraishia capsulata CBS 1993]|uniref:DH domain-containing protein n=1 Tax=Kuraishia capsulata CBS 1993 TaxID=1382522 RepID=W6ML79_9ASCO|nr:uncharacterized protein KUCA_T00002832001 [Kuraishia capsulata CBS 1993]CDK26858.1 unnamed protein product [Kuraishia capsulata CBS 1993]